MATAGILLLASCGDVEAPPKYFTVDGVQVNMAIALLEDFGTDYDITYRSYKLSFRNTENDPSAYLNFMIYSNSTTRIQEGVYDYSYAIRKGFISYIELGEILYMMDMVMPYRECSLLNQTVRSADQLQYQRMRITMTLPLT